MKFSRIICLLLAAVITLCCSTAATAEFDAAYPHLDYEIFEADGRRQARITAYYGDESFVSLPDTLGGAVVTELGDSLFYGDTFLSGIIFPSQLEVIGDYCFMGCTNLKEALVPRTVRHIGAFAFYRCFDLETISLNPPLDYIGIGALEQTDWRSDHPNWYNRLEITEVSTAQELASQMKQEISTDIPLNISAYDRQELRILNDIDCTGVPLRGLLYSPIICGWDAKANCPAMRKISNADFTPSYGYDAKSEFHGCPQCQEQQQHETGISDGQLRYACELHADCGSQCSDCHYGTTWSSNHLGISTDEISYLALDGWTVHSSRPDEIACCDQDSEGVLLFLSAFSAHHLDITDLHYDGKNRNEAVILAYVMSTAENLRLDGLRFTLPENGRFDAVLLLQAPTINRCSVTRTQLLTPATMFFGVLANNRITDALVSEIHADSVGAYIGIVGGDIRRAAVRDMTLNTLLDMAEEEGRFFGAVSFVMYGGLSASDLDALEWEPLCSQIVVDVPDPLLTSPVFLEVHPDILSHTSTPLEQFYYTDEAGRFDPARDFVMDPDGINLATDGIYRVTREQLCSQETLNALNQPLEPGVDKTTGNRWSRGDSYCGGCPVPAACSPIAPPAPAIAYGDVDESGKIDASDALCILQASVHLREFSADQAEAADVNGDYRVDASDALLVLQRSVSLVERFPMDAFPSLFEGVS